MCRGCVKGKDGRIPESSSSFLALRMPKNHDFKLQLQRQERSVTVLFFTSGGVNEGPRELMGSSPELKPSQGNLPPRFPASGSCPRGGI